MCKYIKYIQIVILIFVLTKMCYSKRKKDKNNLENDILEKSEVTLKFPTYAIKMPPIITSRKRTNSKVDPTPVSCTSANVTKSLNELRKKIKCVPRDTVVEITASNGDKVVPNTVVVKRCGGMCSGNKKCISNKKTNVNFYVRTNDQKSTMVFCNKISVPEDTECICDCPIKKRCSSIDQKYDPTLCKCVCTNKDEELECINKADLNFKWSAKTCSCVCKREKICTTGTVWSREKCRCVKG